MRVVPLLGLCSSAWSLQLMDGNATRPREQPVFFTKVGKLPALSNLAHTFQSKLKVENLSPLPESVQLMMGVMSTQDTDPEALDIHRTTWMARAGICAASCGQQPGCTVYVAFVFGDSKAPERATLPDELFLNGTENMNQGKTFQFFQHAAQAYPWTTHIGKMDLDTFPHMYNLTTGLERHLERERTANCSAYFGMPVDFIGCGRFGYCPPRQCGFPQEGNFRRFQAKDPACWAYMQGGLYVLSASLARSASSEGGVWSRNREGPEDLKTGWAISQLAASACVDTWDSVQAFDHLPSERQHANSGRRQWSVGPPKRHSPGQSANKSLFKRKRPGVAAPRP